METFNIYSLDISVKKNFVLTKQSKVSKVQENNVQNVLSFENEYKHLILMEFW